jgi:hypothetical protein
MSFFSFDLLIIFSHTANAAAHSSFQKISSSLEPEISLLLLFFAAPAAAPDSVLDHQRLCSLVFIANAYDYPYSFCPLLPSFLSLLRCKHSPLSILSMLKIPNGY